jgi:hypothetical protein
MRRLVLPLIGALALAATLAGASAASARGAKILEFETMAPVTGAFVGSANPIRGIPGGGIAWKIASAEGELKGDGTLELTVTGLVLNGGSAAINGTNPVGTFEATVSCQTTDATGAAAVVNVTTAPFPATTGAATAGGGNAHVEAKLSLPHPCIAPIVFVRSGLPNTLEANRAWFAATGAP